jgi:hypothetical protein
VRTALLCAWAVLQLTSVSSKLEELLFVHFVRLCNICLFLQICCKGSLFPVNAATIYAAVSPYGAPSKIATYKSFDEAVNALVEFDTDTEAANVVQNLDGQFLYTGRIGLMKCSLSYQTEVIIK